MQFDPSTVKDDAFEALRPGVYRVIVSDVELKATKNGNGKGLNVKFQVIDGPNKGANVFNWLNVEHTNKTAENIGKGELKRLLAAVGHTAGPVDPVQFLGNKTLYIEVDVEEYNGQPKNVVKKYQSQATPGSAPVAHTADTDAVPLLMLHNSTNTAARQDEKAGLLLRKENLLSDLHGIALELSQDAGMFKYDENAEERDVTIGMLRRAIARIDGINEALATVEVMLRDHG